MLTAQMIPYFAAVWQVGAVRFRIVYKKRVNGWALQALTAAPDNRACQARNDKIGYGGTARHYRCLRRGKTRQRGVSGRTQPGGRDTFPLQHGNGNVAKVQPVQKGRGSGILGRGSGNQGAYGVPFRRKPRVQHLQ